MILSLQYFVITPMNSMACSYLDIAAKLFRYDIAYIAYEIISALR